MFLSGFVRAQRFLSRLECITVEVLDRGKRKGVFVDKLQGKTKC